MKTDPKGAAQRGPRTLFIGDLHLSADRPDITAAFERFLASELQHTDALYILGDLFEYWLGDDDRSPFNDHIASLLLQASHHLPIYFCHGNRDFLIGKAFARRAGLTLLDEVHQLDLYGTPTLLLHGDSLCTADIPYQKFRKKRWIYRILSRILPLWKKRQMAENGRKRSQAQQQDNADQSIMDVTPSAVDQLLDEHNAARMIHGHTHRPALHQLSEQRQRLVVGDWYSQESVLVVTPGGVELLSKAL